MVHKKSEYTLQFHNLSNDLRAQIWRDNYMFRETQRRMNTSDHYWHFQLIDDGCECDNESDVDARDERTASLLSNQRDLLVSKSTERQLSLLQDKGAQTPDWQTIEKNTSSTLEGQLIGTEDQKSPFTLEQPKLPETDVGQENPKLKQSIERTAENCVKLKSSSDNLDSNPKISTERRNYNLEQRQSGYLKDHISSKATDSHASNLVYSRLTRTPARNVLKSYPLEKKMAPVFAAFGWNDSDKNVGEQKTYNVRAPLNQVYQSAILASGKRLKELELLWADQLKKKRQQQSLLSIGPVNLSSIWMTEYQEKFSKGKREPLPRSTCYRPIVWRYT